MPIYIDSSNQTPDAGIGMDNLMPPKHVYVDGQRVEPLSIQDQIEADKYLCVKLTDGPLRGLTVNRMDFDESKMAYYPAGKGKKFETYHTYKLGRSSSAKFAGQRRFAI